MRATDVTQPLPFGSDTLSCHVPRMAQVLGCALPHLGFGDRLMLRALALIACRQIVDVRGLDHIQAAKDPFILVANHSTRRESLLVPALLFLSRGGRLLHFLADWNFRLIPGIGFIYGRSQVVTVLRKSARPRFLNALKPFYRDALPPLEQARRHLSQGRSIGIFPEGAVNRDPVHLLRGRHGAARLSLEAGVPIVPMGIRFHGAAADQPARGRAAMELRIGAPLVPPGPLPEASLAAVKDWHAAIMTAIGRQSSKAWIGPTKEPSHD